MYRVLWFLVFIYIYIYMNIKLPRIVNVYVLMHGSWEFSYQGLKIRDYVCDHVSLNEGTLK